MTCINKYPPYESTFCLFDCSFLILENKLFQKNKKKQTINHHLPTSKSIKHKKKTDKHKHTQRKRERQLILLKKDLNQKKKLIVCCHLS